MTYGDKRNYKPIRLYVFSEALKTWQYVSTTTRSRTCREAADKLAGLHPNLTRSNIRGYFAKD